jgi:hypothetical protein
MVRNCFSRMKTTQVACSLVRWLRKVFTPPPAASGGKPGGAFVHGEERRRNHFLPTSSGGGRQESQFQRHRTRVLGPCIPRRRSGMFTVPRGPPRLLPHARPRSCSTAGVGPSFFCELHQLFYQGHLHCLFRPKDQRTKLYLLSEVNKPRGAPAPRLPHTPSIERPFYGLQPPLGS